MLALGARLGWPVLADPRSNLRRPVPGVIGAADAILRSERFADRHTPEVVVRLGEAWVSKAVTAYVSRAAALEPTRWWSIRGGGGPIPNGRWRSSSGPTPPCSSGTWPGCSPDRTVGHRCPTNPRRWWADWQAAEDRALPVIAEALGGPAGKVALTEPALAHRLYASLPDDATLVVALSMPVRDIEAFAAPLPGAGCWPTGGPTGWGGVDGARRGPGRGRTHRGPGG